MTQNSSKDIEIELEHVEGVSPHNKALYEAGKKLLVDSVDVGREFCKFMTNTTLAAIPTYIALLKLVLPKDYSLQSESEIVFLVPPILFIVSAILFVYGYFPQKGRASLDLPADIERERSATIRQRLCCAWIGFSSFLIGAIFGCVLLVSHLSH